MKQIIRLTKLITVCLFIGQQLTSKTEALRQKDLDLDEQYAEQVMGASQELKNNEAVS